MLQPLDLKLLKVMLEFLTPETTEIVRNRERVKTKDLDNPEVQRSWLKDVKLLYPFIQKLMLIEFPQNDEQIHKQFKECW